jgi:uncharacterized protein (DUF433 family)
MDCAHFSDQGGMAQIYKGVFRPDVDPRELALYTPADAACYLGINPQTLSNWLWGRTYQVVGGDKWFEPVVRAADPDNKLLSFFNLAELHVLAATRYKHKISFRAVRRAVETIQKRYPSDHPLISKEFMTNGSDLFVQTLEEDENISTPEQTNFKEIMDLFLRHVVADPDELVNKVFPLIEGQPDDKVISITYGISSSQPAIEGHGVPVWLINDRYNAGEEPESIAADFDLPVAKINRALEYFGKKAA